MAAFCQQCGAPHDEDARFCPKCGRPVGAAAPLSYSEKYAGTSFGNAVAQPVAPASAKRRISPVQFVAGLVVLAVVLAGAVLMIRGGISSGPTVPASADLPPVGQIWFGSTFDPSTFSLSGITHSVANGATVALVGHLPRSISTGQANLRVSIDGQAVVNQAVNMTGSGDLFGTTVGPFSVPGTYMYEIVDVGGNDLASGTLTVN